MAIPTTYKGINFRSRLEAKWAAFFDVIGWRWEYEPYDRSGWIPDFLILGDAPLLVEVKPASSLYELSEMIEKPHLHGKPEVVMLGLSPMLRPGEYSYCGGGFRNDYAGLLRDEYEGIDSVGDSFWFECGQCGSIGIGHSFGSWMGRPCGHYDGDHLLNEWKGIEPAWAKACNVTQWKKNMTKTKATP